MIHIYIYIYIYIYRYMSSCTYIGVDLFNNMSENTFIRESKRSILIPYWAIFSGQPCWNVFFVSLCLSLQQRRVSFFRKLVWSHTIGVHKHTDKESRIDREEDQNMSEEEPINANPQVKDISQLPTRQGKGTAGTNAPLPHDVHSDKLRALVEKYSFEEDEEDLDEMDTDLVDDVEEAVDPQEIYDLISTISDPEHPLTLGQLSVVNLGDIHVKHPDVEQGAVGEVNVKITPTITHCSLATLIGLGIRVRLDRSVSKAYRLGIYVKQGTHQSEGQVNKQLNDKERVCAACENPQLVRVVGRMLATCDHVV